MNAERLLVYIGWLLNDEKEHKVQDALTELSTSITYLASSPQDATYQKSVSDGLITLKKQLLELKDTYDVVQWKGVSGIGAMQFFSEDLYDGIVEIIAENPMTPSLVQQYVDERVKNREKYLQDLRQTQAGLKALSIKPAVIEGEAEIGFQIPRNLFRNNLDGLVEELRAIRRIIRAFSELAVKGSPEEIHIRQISTSDPTFYFGLTAATIAQIGLVVVWALDRWKQLEEIRKVRAETRKLKEFSAQEVADIFDKKIEDTIKQAIDEKTNSLVGSEGVTGRKAEQRTDIAWALEAMFARVERGMNVEIRFIAPKTEKNEDGSDKPEPQVFGELREINTKLNFPEIERNPILKIPTTPADTSSNRGRKPRDSDNPTRND